MNKQQALEALLEVCRKQERPDQEVAVVPHAQTIQELVSLVGDLDVILRTPVSVRRDARLRQTLAALGGRALYLLVDEVELVQGRELDEWLAASEATVNTISVDPGKVTGVVVVNPASYTPVPVNGALLREAYEKGRRDGRG